MPKKKKIQISDDTRVWLKEHVCFPELLTVQFRAQEGLEYREYKILEREPDGRVPAVRDRMGFKGFVIKVQDPLTRKIHAAKLCIAEDYTQEKLDAEMSYCERLSGDQSQIVTHELVGWVAPIKGQPDAKRWLCFIGRWVNGETLEQLLEREPEWITPEHVCEFLWLLTRAILYIEQCELKHDDLHLGNIMLRRNDDRVRIADPSVPEYAVEVVDIGSMKSRDQPTDKDQDDWSSYANCVIRLHNYVHANRAVASRYPRFLRVLKEYVSALADEDHARHFPDNKAYYLYLTRARDSITESFSRGDESRLPSPFEAISAEHLASDRVLLQLFSGKLPWMESLREFSPVVVTGPRGCGKSMVFRYLSLRTHLTSPQAAREALAELPFFGIYLGCASDLQNDLLWIKRTPGKARQLAEPITTFFSLVLARELFRTISSVRRIPEVATSLGVADSVLREMAEFVRAELTLPGNIPLTARMDVGQTLADELDRARRDVARAMFEGTPTSVHAAPTFVRDLSRQATRLIPGLSQHRIVYFLDDYTVHRLGAEVQEVLNSIVWQRDSTFCFKVSSEPFGFIPTHLDGARIDANREYTPINVGLHLHSGSMEDVAIRREFIEGLLDKRFDAASYKANAQMLIGESDYKQDTELADAIRRKGMGRAHYYYGLNVLSNAWSGDVATILFVVREMCQRGNVTKETTSLISPKHQHDALVHVSKSLVERVRHYHPFGTEMRRSLDAFGGLARRLLMEGKEQRDKDSSKVLPQRRYRIEITLDGDGTIYDHIDRLPGGGKVKAVFQEMVRRSLLIDLEESRGKEGPERRTARFQIRASLLPNYGTSLTRKNYLQVRDLLEFCLLLDQPDEWHDRLWKRYGAISRSGDLFEAFEPEGDDVE